MRCSSLFYRFHCLVAAVEGFTIFVPVSCEANCPFLPLKGEPMRIIYRMRGLLGDATEEFIESLDSTTGQLFFEFAPDLLPLFSTAEEKNKI